LNFLKKVLANSNFQLYKVSAFFSFFCAKAGVENGVEKMLTKVLSSTVEGRLNLKIRQELSAHAFMD